jgi:hypothetical protein
VYNNHIALRGVLGSEFVYSKDNSASVVWGMGFCLKASRPFDSANPYAIG